eukprot:s258_g16.t1
MLDCGDRAADTAKARESFQSTCQAYTQQTETAHTNLRVPVDLVLCAAGDCHMEDGDLGPGLAVLQDLLKRPGPDVVRWAVEQAQSLARPGTNVQQSQIFQMAGALNAASVAEKQELVRAAISGFGQLPADQRAEALRLVVNTAAAAQVGPHPTAEGEVPPLMQNVMAVVKEAKLHEMPKEDCLQEKAILVQEARQDAAEMVQPQQILEVVSELRPEERHQVTEVTASTMPSPQPILAGLGRPELELQQQLRRPVYAGSGNGPCTEAEAGRQQ